MICLEDKEAFQYGCKTFIYSLLSTIVLIIIGGFFHKPLDTILLIGTFYLNQTIGGGFHAKSYFSCFGITAIGLILALLTLAANFPLAVYIVPTVLSMGFLLFHPVYLHENKHYLNIKIKKL